MTSPKTPLERRLQFASFLSILGLAVEAGSLLWSHPLAFLGFIFPGGALILAGILIYLYSLLSPS